MAAGDFSDLQLSLRGCPVMPACPPSPRGIWHCQQCINEAYTQIFIPEDDTPRPRFAKKTFGFQYQAR